MPLVRIAAEEPVEVLEAQAPGPLVEGPGRTLLPFRNQVENIADGAGTLRHDRGVAWIPRGEFRDVAHADAVVVAAGEKCGPGRGTKRGGVELVVTQSALCHAIEGWRGNRTAEGTSCAEASVVGHDE
jgi:hypothetical protein